MMNVLDYATMILQNYTIPALIVTVGAIIVGAVWPANDSSIDDEPAESVYDETSSLHDHDFRSRGEEWHQTM